MAEVGDAGGNKDVQAYLEQHKITSLFESLMSKVVKERPADPLEFLIGRLQVIQRQRINKAISPAHTVPSTFTSRSKIQVTGKSVTPKSSATTKAKSAEQMAKTTGARPAKPRATGMMSSSTSALKRSIPTKTTPTKPTSSPRRPGTSGSGLKTPTSILKASHRPTTAPVTSRVVSTAAVGRCSAAAKKKDIKPSSSLGKSPASNTSSLSKPAHEKEKASVTTKKSKQGDSAPKVKEERGKEIKGGEAKRQAREPSAEEISEFFGEAKKSSSRQLQYDSEEGGEYEEVDEESRYSDSEESDVMEGVVRGVATKEAFDIEEIVQKRLRSRCGKRSHGKLQSLLSPSPPEARPSSLGYHSDSQDGEETDSGESDGVEVVEDYTVLEDEGVTGLSRGKYAIHKILSSSVSAKVDLKVVVCSRCARVIAAGEQMSEVTESQLTHTFTRSLEGDFESASQIGSQPLFPQWEASSAATGSEIDGGSSGRLHDLSSDVTLQSRDTWGGLAPPTRMQTVPSDTDSEVQLPAPPALEGKSWQHDPPNQHDPHGWATTH